VAIDQALEQANAVTKGAIGITEDGCISSVFLAQHCVAADVNIGLCFIPEQRLVDYICTFTEHVNSGLFRLLKLQMSSMRKICIDLKVLR
jgi:hypothetical protein